MPRILRGNGFHDLVDVGMPAPWKNGPMLEHAEYPQVLVAKAVSDGQVLDLQLAAGAAHGRFRLELSQLQPDRPYRTSGAVESGIRADGRGHAFLHVDLDRVLDVRIAPAH